MPSRAVTLRLLTAAGLTCAARPLGAQQQLPLQLGAMPTDGSAGAVYASDQGFFRAGGLDVALTILTNTSSLANAVSGGTLEIGFGSIIPLAQAHARGIEFRIIWPAAMVVGPGSPNRIVVAKSSPFERAADLNGKVFAVNGLRDLTQYEVEAWVDKNGGDVKSIKLVEIPFAEIGTALASGRVDAGIIAEPFLSNAKDTVRIIGDPAAAIGPRFALTCWFALADWLARNGETAQRFAAIMERTARWANAHHPETAAILSRVSKIPLGITSTMTRSFLGETPPVPALFHRRGREIRCAAVDERRRVDLASGGVAIAPSGRGWKSAAEREERAA